LKLEVAGVKTDLMPQSFKKTYKKFMMRLLPSNLKSALWDNVSVNLKTARLMVPLLLHLHLA
jgi:hypothetical protein